MLDEDLAELYDVETRRLNTPETYDRYEDGLDRRAGQRFPYDFLLNSGQYSKVERAPKAYI
jgi:hypothetical protein